MGFLKKFQDTEKRECGEEPDFGEVNHIKRYDLRTGRKV